MPLLDCHVRHLDQSLDTRYLAATDPLAKWDQALAGLENLQFWYRWLWTLETFSAKWWDYQVDEHQDDLQVDLLVGVGVVGCCLQSETKCNHTSRPNYLMS